MRGTSLSCITLNDLLEINTEGPTPSNFSPDSAIDFWWSDCQSGRRPNQKPRKEYRQRQKTTEGSDSDGSEVELLDIEKWDSWFDDDNDQEV